MRYLNHPLAIIIFTLLSAIFSFSLYSGMRITTNSAEQVAVLEQEIAQSTSEVLVLQEEEKRASSSATQERIIRDELLMLKAGDRVIQMPVVATSPLPIPSHSPSPTNWQHWRLLLW